jgi:hypothetical protein
MILRRSFFGCVFVLSSGVFGAIAAEDDPEVFIYSVRLDKQTELVWAIKRSRLMAISAWREGAEEPPLSPNKAVAIADEYVQSHLGVHAANVLWIYIRRIAIESGDRWTYDIDYSTDAPLISDDPRLHVSVAMDGKVIVPGESDGNRAYEVKII